MLLIVVSLLTLEADARGGGGHGGGPRRRGGPADLRCLMTFAMRTTRTKSTTLACLTWTATIMFKIDYYDRGMSMHSPDPADPSATQRVITIMLAEEY
jgi:hypothetical protein